MTDDGSPPVQMDVERILSAVTAVEELKRDRLGTLACDLDEQSQDREESCDRRLERDYQRALSDEHDIMRIRLDIVTSAVRANALLSRDPASIIRAWLDDTSDLDELRNVPKP